MIDQAGIQDPEVHFPLQTARIDVDRIDGKTKVFAPEVDMILTTELIDPEVIGMGLGVVAVIRIQNRIESIEEIRGGSIELQWHRLLAEQTEGIAAPGCVHAEDLMRFDGQLGVTGSQSEALYHLPGDRAFPVICVIPVGEENRIVTSSGIHRDTSSDIGNQ